METRFNYRNTKFFYIQYCWLIYSRTIDRRLYTAFCRRQDSIIPASAIFYRRKRLVNNKLVKNSKRWIALAFSILFDTHTHTHTHTYIYIYIYIYLYIYIYIYILRERERESEIGGEQRQVERKTLRPTKKETE